MSSVHLSLSSLSLCPAGDDYVNTTQVIEFTSASTQTVSVSLIGNSVVEGDKWFVGRLRGTAMGGVILTQDSVNIMIEEDDSEQWVGPDLLHSAVGV